MRANQLRLWFSSLAYVILTSSALSGFAELKWQKQRARASD